MTTGHDERLTDLLVKEATESLDEAERSELAQLLRAQPVDRTAYERLAAGLSLAAGGDEEPLPPALAARITAVGEAYVGGVRAGTIVDLAPRVTPHGPVIAWWAAAASLLLAVFGWYPRLAAPPTPVAAAEGQAERAERELGELLARPGLVRSSFSGTADPASGAVDGDVIWDPATQRGYLRLRGLPANDARQAQYQLWVFDATRDQKYPVDGGVFDVPSGERPVVVPIRVPIRVGQAVLFAITVERPGGVVVSGREHIVATAKPSAT